VTAVTDGDAHGSGGTTRRPLLKLAAGGAALASVGVAARLTLHPGDDEPGTEAGALVLSAVDGSDVASLTVPLGDDLLPGQGSRRWESRRLPTSTHSMVGFTWGADEESPQVRIRSRTGNRWGGWQRVPLLHDVPDEPGAGSVLGTDLVWIGLASGVQIRVEGRRPADLALVLLHPARRASDLVLDQQVSARALETEEEATRVPRPDLIGRSDWGANESLRSGRPTYNDTVRQVHVHHTVNSNSYERGDVPAMIRGMYAYHTQSLGWSDIGYNFLVDRFGRAYVGRAGGAAKLVRGAHTLGFNHDSVGISAIGNYEIARPTSELLSAVAAVAAWKLARFDRKPREKIRVTSTGSDRYSAGQSVLLPVIDGHRDTNETACPGQYLYASLPKVRRRANKIINGASQTAIVVEQPASVAGTAHLGQVLTARPGRYQPEGATVSYRWLRGERPIRGAREQTYSVRPLDVGHRLTCQVRLTSGDLDPVVQVPEPMPVATADPVLTLEPSARKRVVSVRVALTAPTNVRPTPEGQVTVTVGERSRTVTLSEGEAVVRFGRHRKHPRGRFPVTATYGGKDAFTAASGTGTVRVD
jgi:hypothetical protein